MGTALSTQGFSNFKHDCSQISFSANETTLIGMNCNSGGSTTTHQSHLNLDLCLSYNAPNLVAHQGGGYISTSNCTDCNGDNVYDYSCICYAYGVWTLAHIDLTTFIGVSETNDEICCNAGTDEVPAVRCGDLQTGP